MSIEKNDKVLDLARDEKLKVQLEIRKMTSDLKKDVVNSNKKTDAITKLDKHFDTLINKGVVDQTELTAIKQDSFTAYSETKISSSTGQDTPDQNITEGKVVDEYTTTLIDDVNARKMKENPIKDNKGALELQKKMDQEIEVNLVTIDKLAEERYKTWPGINSSNPQMQDIAFTGYARDIAYEVDKQLLSEEEQRRMGYRFQLLELKQSILSQNTGNNYNNSTNNLNNSTNNLNNSTNNLNNSTNNLNNSVESGTNEIAPGRIDISDLRPTYIDLFTNINLKTDITRDYIPSENIYENTRMRQVMKRILQNDDNEIEKLRTKTFGVNFSKANGFAGILATLSENGISTNNGCQLGDYTFILENDKIKVSKKGELPRDITGSDLRKMKKAEKIIYTHEDGFLQIDNELAKMAKIMNAANWKDLQEFTDLSGVRDAQYSTMKETVNAQNNPLLTSETVFQFLCDRNGDGTLSADGKRNREQKNLGDIGNIFGQQLNWTIEQASKVQEVLHPGQGEKIIIQNIIRNIAIQNPRAEKELELYNTLDNCTRSNLVSTIKDYPRFKTYFTAAIEKMNGGSSVLTPDLYDNLTGNMINTLLKSQDWEFRGGLETKIDAALKANKELQEYLKTHNTIELRESLITQIMNVADGFTLIGSNTQEDFLRNRGISKEFVDQEVKNKFITDLTQKTISAITVGVFNPQNGIRIPIGFVKNRKSLDGRHLASIHAEGGPGFNWQTQELFFTLGIGGEVAEQYNYKKVINASLDAIQSAKYLGVEGQAIVGVSAKDLNMGVEASAGINWQKDPVMGINQINRQYEMVSKRLFSNLEAKDVSSYDNLNAAFARNINALLTGGPLSKFVETNKARLQENARFILKFLEVNKVRDAITNKKPTAINELISIIQTGNMEQWRGDLLNNLHDKTMITKLSFGVTTNALTMAFGSNKPISHPNSGLNGGTNPVDVNNNNNNPISHPNSGLNGGTNPVDLANAGDRFGLVGFYVGMRISNWQTEYHINDNQLVNTRREIAEGSNIENITMKNPEQYAKYLSALFNKEGTTGIEITYIKTDGKIRIFNHTNPKVPLIKLLNIRVTNAAKSEINYNTADDVLTIGNVGEISASTVVTALGVERRLCLGSKKYKDGNIINLLNTDQNIVHNYTMEESHNYEATNMNDITTLISEQKDTTGEIIAQSPFEKNQAAKSLFTQCFDAKGQIKEPLPNNVSRIRNKGLDYNTVSAGKIIIFKHNTDDTYTLSLAQNTNPEKLSLRFIDKDNYINGQKLKFTKIEGTSAKIDTFATKELKIKETFKDFNVKKYGVLDSFFNKKLNKKDSKQEFLDFMNATDLTVQKSKLIKLLPQKDETLQPIIDALNNDADPETQNYIIDQFRGIFAYEISYEQYTMNSFWERRSPIDKKTKLRTYPFLNALEISDFDLQQEILETRKTMLAQKKNEKTTEKYNSQNWETIPNLIGFTAFYKNGVTPQGSLVSAGDTKVMKIKGEPYTPISETNTDKAKSWIANKLSEKTPDNKDKYKEQKEILLDGIKKKISDTSIYAEISKNFATLIEKGEITLDNSTKKVILKTRPVVYFKAECVNESVGLIIDGLEIQETPVQDIAINKEYLVASGRMDSVANTNFLEQTSVVVKDYISGKVQGNGKVNDKYKKPISDPNSNPDGGTDPVDVN